jgi:hypothetical protein
VHFCTIVLLHNILVVWFYRFIIVGGLLLRIAVA